MDAASLTVSDRRGITVVTLPVCDLVEHTVAMFRPQLLNLLPTGPARWVLHLPSAEFVASAGIGLIVQLAQKLTAIGGRLAVCTTRPEVVRLFQGPPHFLSSVAIFSQLDDAVNHLSPH